jgi:hypothetical protein
MSHTRSADGVPLALSEDIPIAYAEQLAAITSGLARRL